MATAEFSKFANHILEETKIWIYGCTHGKYSKVLCLVIMKVSFEVSKVLAIRNNAVITMGVQYLFKILLSILLGIYLEVELLDDSNSVVNFLRNIIKIVIS